MSHSVHHVTQKPRKEATDCTDRRRANPWRSVPIRGQVCPSRSYAAAAQRV